MSFNYSQVLVDFRNQLAKEEAQKRWVKKALIGLIVVGSLILYVVWSSS